ncbi:MAG: transglutaminase family protein [Desulfuromonadaceae bacterium]
MVAIRSLATILTYVIGLCGMIPLFPWLTVLPRMVLLAGLIFGVWQDLRGRWQLKSWMQNVAIVPVFFYYALQFSRENPIQPVITILAIMLAVRLSGEKTVRYSLQIYVLSMFCLASSSLFDLSPVFLLYLGVMLFVVAVALVLLTFQDQDQAMAVALPDLKRILLSALLMPALSVPLLLAFFPIMPRTQLPLWHFINPAPLRTSGYADAVEPGSQSSIAESGSLAFRAEMAQQTPAQLYWRGTVFNRTDGVRWSRVDQVPAERPVMNARTVEQVIYPEPGTTRTLTALDRSASISLPRVKRSADGVFELIGTAGRRLSYTAYSLPDGVFALRNPEDSRFYLQQPERLPSRIKALAAEIVRAGEDDRARVEAVENHFRNGSYRYSTVDLPTGDMAIEQFVFDKKQGHCEFFASSFALLLRAAGVPCRLVGGYLGGEYNQLGGYYLVTDAKAHVWVEAYIKNSGWTRIDPSSFATNAGDVWRPPGLRSLKLRINQAIDSFNHLWNRSLITYDFEQQIKIAGRVGSRLQGVKLSNIFRDFIPYLIGMFLLAGLLYCVRRTSLFTSREQRILNSFLLVIEREFDISPGKGGAGLFEMASTADNDNVSEFVAIYAGAVYRDRRLTDMEYQRMQQILRVLSGKSRSTV